ncbi:glycosyltransferase family 4 protein [Aequorivita antarctica]|uniref:Glycosyltransferase family 4 protein n=1 Tax=Aequorivita antarctica TaxID=153266 RepID=A0A5C6YX25_9FLAO|nr:glycosyltransferase family 4 protein [Aequorivita antarctica]TXD71638.1 glycosyltransferase family 4 protein [Aequorivita antarctica]SRX75906.1 D-inositol 3-phosphate glycosyltransferase [Aequorivita antarctica]
MKKKVLFILHLPPPVHGSSMVGKYIMDSSIINTSITSEYINLGTSKSLDEIGKNPLQKIGLYLKIVFQTLKQLMVFKPDLVYIALTAKGKAFYKDAFIAVLAKLFGRKIVYHLHNRSMVERQEKWLDVMLCKMLFKNTDVILLSKYLYPEIQKYVPQSRVHFCPNGIPEFSSTIIAREKEDSQEVQILFLSNLMKAKGVFVLLEACKILKEKQLPFHCTFIGGESDITSEMFQKKVTELGLSEKIHYAGKKYGAEKEWAFSEADIFAFPTLNETFGLVNLEAMQFSLPVVSTLEGGIPDIILEGKTGFLVEKDDAQAFAEKLEMLIVDPVLRLKMGREGRKRYEENFTLEAFENCFTTILNELIK